MRDGSRIIYIGETGRGFYRCLQGFKLKTKQFAAYKWRTRKDLKNADIECLVFDGFRPYGVLKAGRDRKAIEAGVAFEVRLLIGHWPVKLSSLDVCGKIDRTERLADFSRCIVQELQSRG